MRIPARSAVGECERQGFTIIRGFVWSLQTNRLTCEGMDFVTYLCNDLVLRVPKRDEVAGLVNAEYELLRGLPNDLPLAVPRPMSPLATLATTIGTHYPVLVYPLVPGTALGDVEGNVEGNVDPERVGTMLGGFLRSLHAVSPKEVAPATDFQEWGSIASQKLPGLAEILGVELTQKATIALAQSLPPTRTDLVMCHRDLTEDHVLVGDTGLVCGVIDFGDAGPSPWWHDLVGIWMWGGEIPLQATCSAYGRTLDEDERQLLEFHALTVAVWDVFHTSKHHDAANLLPDELATLRRLLST